MREKRMRPRCGSERMKSWSWSTRAYASGSGGGKKSRESHPKLQPVNPFIAGLKRFLKCHVGVRTEYLAIYAARIAFEPS